MNLRSLSCTSEVSKIIVNRTSSRRVKQPSFKYGVIYRFLSSQVQDEDDVNVNDIMAKWVLWSMQRWRLSKMMIQATQIENYTFWCCHWNIQQSPFVHVCVLITFMRDFYPAKYPPAPLCLRHHCRSEFSINVDHFQVNLKDKNTTKKSYSFFHKRY